jgi:hypothetical protein
MHELDVHKGREHRSVLRGWFDILVQYSLFLFFYFCYWLPLIGACTLLLLLVDLALSVCRPELIFCRLISGATLADPRSNTGLIYDGHNWLTPFGYQSVYRYQCIVINIWCVSLCVGSLAGAYTLQLSHPCPVVFFVCCCLLLWLLYFLLLDVAECFYII